MEVATSPLVLGLALVTVLTVLVVAELRHRRRVARTRTRLPKGADAALWSIVEAVPDPRNHLALTRDLSGEVRLTEQDRRRAAAAYAEAGTARTTRVRARREVPGPTTPSAPDSPTAAAARGEAPDRPPVTAGARRRGSNHDADDEDLTLSAQLFFTGEPELKPF
jgi:hypothetical protein